MPAVSLALIPDVPLELVLLAGRALFLVFSFVVAAVAFTRWRRAAERDTEQATARANVLLERLTAIETALAATDARVTALAQQHEENARTAGMAGPSSYGIAIRLARGGASREDLMAGCGLTQQESDLVLRLHGRDRRAHSAAA
jgi:hypothetical protein